MPVITIINCRIFEDEVVHLIEKESELKEVIIVKNENSIGLIRKLEEIRRSTPHSIRAIEEIYELLGRGRTGGRIREEVGKEEEKEEAGKENRDLTLTLVVNVLGFP